MPELHLIPNYTTSWIGNTFGGGSQWVQDFIDDMVVEDRGQGFRCYTNSEWDEAHSERGEYWFDQGGWHMIQHNLNDGTPAVSSKSATIGGKTFTAADIPGSAFGVYRPKNFLMVAGSDHTIGFYDVSTTTPTLVKKLGTPGGIMAGEAGKVTPTKFWAITGCGSDAAGNLYVSMSEQGALIRRFAVIDAQALTWDEVNIAEAAGMHFSDVCDFDPNSDGAVIYGKNERYEMDYSKPPGKQWKLVGYTYGPKLADDPRNKNQQCIKVRYKDGVRFLFSIDQGDGAVNLYRFNGEILEWFSRITGSGGVSTMCVDHNCDIWEVVWEGDDSVAKRIRCTGIVDGKLQHDPPTTFRKIPAPITRAQKLLYDSARDTMFVGGGTALEDIEGGAAPGPVICKFSNWSTNPVLDWQILVPWLHSEIQPALRRIVPNAWDFAGNRLYVAYGFYDVQPDLPAPYNGSPGPIRVYDSRNGEFLGRLLAGPEVHHNSGSIDLGHGIAAFQRADGKHLILLEEIWKNKNLLYIYTPVDGPGTPLPPPPPLKPAAYRINSGGKNRGGYSADRFFTGGNTYVEVNEIITTGVTDPGPQSIYQIERWGDFSYQFPALTLGKTYKVRLHWAEIYHNNAGDRIFHVDVNGVRVLSDFDVFAAAGGRWRAVVREFPAAANAQGRIDIAFITVKDQAKIGGIEILEDTGEPTTMTKLSELAGALNNIDAKLTKAKTEITAEIAKLKESLAGIQITPEAEAALTKLTASAQVLDDVVPDTTA